MVTYEYTGKTTSPDLTKIHSDVATSAMTDKQIDSCRWDENTAILKVFWADSLDAADKIILDGIVTANS